MTRYLGNFPDAAEVFTQREGVVTAIFAEGANVVFRVESPNPWRKLGWDVEIPVRDAAVANELAGAMVSSAWVNRSAPLPVKIDTGADVLGREDFAHAAVLQIQGQPPHIAHVVVGESGNPQHFTIRGEAKIVSAAGRPIPAGAAKMPEYSHKGGPR